MGHFRAQFTIIALYLSTISAKYIGVLLRRSPQKGSRDIVVIATFHNVGWFHAHVGPLVKCEGVETIFVVCDAPIELDSDKVRFCCPSSLMVRRFGRQLSRLLTVLRLGWRHGPALYMGYHIMPNGVFALFAARLFRAKSAYQLTGGPIQLIGGGYQSDNYVLRAVGRFSRLQEKILFSLSRRFDACIVRGSSAKKFVQDYGLSTNCFAITGAVNSKQFMSFEQDADKQYDLVYVGRLDPSKGLDLLVEVVSEIREDLPGISVAIVGDGPYRRELEDAIAERDLHDRICFLGQLDNVAPILSQARIFVLLSLSEGVSIAVLEAMTVGMPVVCRNVGDLSDAVVHDRTGLLLDTKDPVEISSMLARLLKDNEQLREMGERGRSRAINMYGVEAMADRWATELDRLLVD